MDKIRCNVCGVETDYGVRVTMQSQSEGSGFGLGMEVCNDCDRLVGLLDSFSEMHKDFEDRNGYIEYLINKRK